MVIDFAKEILCLCDYVNFFGFIKVYFLSEVDWQLSEGDWAHFELILKKVDKLTVGW